MESFSRGWKFLTQAWKMATNDKDLLKPSIYAMLVGFIVSMIGIIPLVLSVLILGTDSNFARLVLGFFGALLVFAQYAVTYIFSAMTVKLIYDYLTDGDGRMDQAWEIVKRDWLDILSLAAASTLVNIIKNAVRGNGKNRNFLREAVANLIDTVWTEATFLVLPIMVIEDENLKDGLKRATFIVKSNLLLVGISAVGVRWVTGLIGFIFGVVGLLVGFGVAFPLISIAGASTPLVVLAVILGVLLASVFFMAANVISSYTSTAYHTCLYLWARNTEKAGQGVQASIPAPLAAVLGR
ncbi:MAG: DUF6159 family protein [Chloroflexi bacterium]|nr:DUF6159 family protein [Chloroflexota bacterium]